MSSNTPDPATLNTVQQVLRQVVLAMAAATKADLATLSTLLGAATAHPDIDPIAKEMMADLSIGIGVVAKLQKQPGQDH